MPDVVEGKVKICFPEKWAVVKYDDHTFYKIYMNGMQGTLDERREGTKGLDLIAADGKDVLLIEVKDFRRHRIENKRRMKGPELALEIALKVRDTVAGIFGAVRTQGEGQPWMLISNLIARPTGPNPIGVYLVLAQDSAVKEEMDALTEAVRKKMRWLTTRVWVGEPVDLPRLFPDLEVIVQAKSE